MEKVQIMAQDRRWGLEREMVSDHVYGHVTLEGLKNLDLGESGTENEEGCPKAPLKCLLLA